MPSRPRGPGRATGASSRCERSSAPGRRLAPRYPSRCRDAAVSGAAQDASPAPSRSLRWPSGSPVCWRQSCSYQWENCKASFFGVLWGRNDPLAKRKHERETIHRSLGCPDEGYRVPSLKAAALATFSPFGDSEEGQGSINRVRTCLTSQRSFAMKMSSQMVERTLSQFEAQPVPDDHPAVTQLRFMRNAPFQFNPKDW